MFARKLQASWPRIKSSLKLMLGSGTESALVLKLADSPVCRRPRILRNTAVFLGTSTVIFASAAWATNLNEARWWEVALKDQLDTSSTTLCGPITSMDEKGPTRFRVFAALDHLRRWHDAYIRPLPRPFDTVGRDVLEGVWTFARHSDVYRMFKVITAVNVGIFLAWRLPRCRRFLITHMLHNGLSGRGYTMFLSGFSHMDLPHLALNTVSLWCFLEGLQHVASMDGACPQWTYSMPQLAAFCIVAGGFSFYLPQLISLIAFRKAIMALPPTATLMTPMLEPWHPAPLLFTHGASGMVYAIIAVMFCSADQSEPFITVAGYDISAMQLGVAWAVGEATVHLFAWTGAPGHLSGALFGVLYYYWGSGYWRWMRDHVGNRRTWYEVDENGERIRACVRPLNTFEVEPAIVDD